MKIFLNSKLVSHQKAYVTVQDSGFLYGDGIFETLRAYRGVIFRLDQHLIRLSHSANSIRLKLPFRKEKFRTILYKTLRANHLHEAILRLTVTRGPHQWGRDPFRLSHPTVVVMTRPFKEYPRPFYQKGVKCILASSMLATSNPILSQIKSTSFLLNILARNEARRSGATEAILQNQRGEVMEGAFSNLFLVKRRVILTPPVSLGLLPGITRQAILELANSLGLELMETSLNPTSLYKADEIFLTNTSFGVMPATVVQGRRIGTGKPGRITKLLSKAYEDLILKECP